LYVATIRSSERTSSVKEALKRYIAYREEIDRVRKRVINALLYPAILLVVGGCVIAFLLLYVVPRFAGVYEEMAADLPFYSSLLLSLGRWMQANGFLALAIAVIAIAGTGYALARAPVRAALIEYARRAPFLGTRMKIYQLARVYRTFGMLLRSGIPALAAFDMMSGLLTPDLRPALARAKAMVSEGQAMSTALTAVGLATAVATRLMLVGERSGQMGELMDHIAKFYDDSTARSVDAFTRVFEPLLMTVIGAGVGLVVVLMYMPIFELASAVQ
jgi:general secretion pathway protein F